MLAGCGNKTADAVPTGAPAEEGTTSELSGTPTESPLQGRNVVPAWTDYLTEEDMQKASPWQVCDDSALAAVMKKAEAGEPVTIATIGGSITQGTISTGPLDKEIKTKDMREKIEALMAEIAALSCKNEQEIEQKFRQLQRQTAK